MISFETYDYLADQHPSLVALQDKTEYVEPGGVQRDTGAYKRRTGHARRICLLPNMSHFTLARAKAL
eukprot:6206195-Pleurochrysis_carterae.AAC.3